MVNRAALHSACMAAVTAITLSISAQLQPGHLLLFSPDANQIWHFDANGEFIDRLWARVGQPISQAVGPDGHLYVLGHESDNVCRFDLETGEFIDEFLRDEALRLARCIRFRENGNILIANTTLGNIIEYDGVTGERLREFISSGVGGLAHPVMMLSHPDGSLLVMDWGESYDENAILRFDSATGEPMEPLIPVDPGNGLETPRDMTFGPDGHLYVADWSHGSVLRYDGETGEFIDTFVQDAYHPSALIFTPAGDLLVGLDYTVGIDRYDGETGEFIGEFVDGRAGGLHTPRDFRLQDGKLFVCSAYSGDVLVYDALTGELIPDVIKSGIVSGPSHASYGPDGHLYVTDSYSGAVARFNGRTGAPIDQFVTAASGSLYQPNDHAWGPDGDLYVGGSVVRRYDGRTGEYLSDFISGSERFEHPGYLEFRPLRQLFVGAWETGVVDAFDAWSGERIRQVAPRGQVDIWRFRGMAFDPQGDLFISEWDPSAVQRFDGATGEYLGAFVEAVDFTPNGLTFGPDGNLYIAGSSHDGVNGGVYRFDGETGEFIDLFALMENGWGRPEELLFVPGYTLFGPYPAVENSTNRMSVIFATPGERTYFVAGLSDGSANVPGCPGLVVDMSQPRIVGSSVADDEGVARIEVFVPRVGPREVLVQAVEPSTCTKTPLVRVAFRSR